MQINPIDDGPWEKYLTGDSDKYTAQLDYNGAAHTQIIVTRCQSSTDYAAGWCNAYTFPDGKTKGYLPALGELYLAYQNKSAIDAALAKCGGTALVSNYYWTSTFWGQYSEWNRFWMLNWSNGDFDYTSVDVNFYVRAFGAH